MARLSHYYALSARNGLTEGVIESVGIVMPAEAHRRQLKHKPRSNEAVV